MATVPVAVQSTVVMGGSACMCAKCWCSAVVGGCEDEDGCESGCEGGCESGGGGNGSGVTSVGRVVLEVRVVFFRSGILSPSSAGAVSAALGALESGTW